jgi:hypothetical protein
MLKRAFSFKLSALVTISTVEYKAAEPVILDRLQMQSSPSELRRLEGCLFAARAVSLSLLLGRRRLVLARSPFFSSTSSAPNETAPAVCRHESSLPRSPQVVAAGRAAVRVRRGRKLVGPQSVVTRPAASRTNLASKACPVSVHQLASKTIYPVLHNGADKREV